VSAYEDAAVAADVLGQTIMTQIEEAAEQLRRAEAQAIALGAGPTEPLTPQPPPRPSPPQRPTSDVTFATPLVSTPGGGPYSGLMATPASPYAESTAYLVSRRGLLITAGTCVSGAFAVSRDDGAELSRIDEEIETLQRALEQAQHQAREAEQLGVRVLSQKPGGAKHLAVAGVQLAADRAAGAQD
jgi:hypothetical protein